MITIFTPTYNRAKTLNRVYKSLISQNDYDFEWLIVDDGSTDNTEEIVSEFISEGIFHINYIKKKNGGKHTAHNVAVKNAKGEWFLCLDSDDILAEGAIEKLKQGMNNIIETDCGLICNKRTDDGKLLSGTIEVSDVHYGLYQYTKVANACGEYTLLFKTDILRQYVYPEIYNERFSTECIVYDQLEMDGYTFSVLDEVIEICEYQEDGLTKNILKCLTQSPTGYQIFHKQRIDLVDTFKERLNHALRYHAFKALSHNREYLYQGKHALLVNLTYIPGTICSLYYKLRT